MEPYRFHPGHTPLLVSMPHVGTHVPEALARRMTKAALDVPDTDWNVDRLYDFLGADGASVLVATHSRYVIDLNRPPDNRPLYPGASNTELCPLTLFDDSPIYVERGEPDAMEVALRLDRYWRPYHHRLAETLAAVREKFGVALLFDAHSIRSRVKRFFDGRLPDLNLGTADGRSAAADLTGRLVEIAAEAEGYSTILNGRFKGGYTTRHYGKPANGVHAIQLELAQSTYMDEDPPFGFRDDLAASLRPTLRAMIGAMTDWAARQPG